jgi:hypothetical protein
MVLAGNGYIFGNVEASVTGGTFAETLYVYHCRGEAEYLFDAENASFFNVANAGQRNKALPSEKTKTSIEAADREVPGNVKLTFKNFTNEMMLKPLAADSMTGDLTVVLENCDTSLGNYSTTEAGVTTRLNRFYILQPGTPRKLDGTLSVTATNCTMSNYNAMIHSTNVTGSVTNTLTNCTLSSDFWGGSWDDANIDGTLTNVITNCKTVTFNAFAKGGEAKNGVVNRIDGLSLIEGKSDYVCSFGGNGTGTINAGTRAYAIETTAENLVWDGSVAIGGTRNTINGDVYAKLISGSQPSGRHLIVGSMRTAYPVTEGGVTTVEYYKTNGSVTLDVEGGNWGWMYLGNRNRQAEMDGYTDPCITGDVTVNVYGGGMYGVRRGYSYTENDNEYVCPSNVGGDLTVNYE